MVGAVEKKGFAVTPPRGSANQENGNGNLGDVKSVGGKVSEARIFSSPAVRLYFTILDGVVIILLCGGGKSDQPADIARAHELAAQLLEVNDET